MDSPRSPGRGRNAMPCPGAACASTIRAASSKASARAWMRAAPCGCGSATRCARWTARKCRCIPHEHGRARRNLAVRSGQLAAERRAAAGRRARRRVRAGLGPRAVCRAAGRASVGLAIALGRAARLHEALRRFPAAQVAWLRSPRRACGITNSYAVAERFGIDRFLALVAVHARVRGAAVVAGCGTALTLDAIDAQGVHRAGLISASPQLMLAGLRGATAIADSNPDAFDTANGDDTERALRAGCWNAAGALTEWFAAQQRTTLGDAETWLHGGWAPPLAAWLERAGCRARVIGDAVLQGLALWSAAHSENTAVP